MARVRNHDDLDEVAEALPQLVAGAVLGVVAIGIELVDPPRAA
ncbi:hypothetical protein [Pseudonocardia sp. DSM 110487]|nr:hypothetical protein [Pseudonocardia sp. DSM 110487]